MINKLIGFIWKKNGRTESTQYCALAKRFATKETLEMYTNSEFHKVLEAILL